MTSVVVALVFSWCSIVMAAVTCRMFLPGQALAGPVGRGLAFWLFVTPFVFLFPNTLSILAISTIIFIVLMPKARDELGVFYVMALFAVPSGLFVELSLPGINSLANLDFLRCLSIVLCCVMLMSLMGPRSGRSLSLPQVLIICLTLLSCLLSFRSSNFTSGLRESLDIVLFTLIPFLAAASFFTTRSSFDKLFVGFIALALVHVFVSFLSQFFFWNFYAFAEERLGGYVFADIRNGILRVSVTSIPILVGFVATLGLIAVEYFRSIKAYSFLGASALRVAFVGAAVVTYSRGAWLAMAMAVAVFYFLKIVPRRWHARLVWLGLLSGAAFGYNSWMHADFSSVDEFGTFDYRKRLLEAAGKQISEHPIWGDRDFLGSGHFDHLVQGEGLIDVVNYYLQILLEFGFIGLLLFASAFVVIIVRLFKLGSQPACATDRGLEAQRASMISILAGYLVMIATVSDVSIVAPIGMICLGLACAFVGLDEVAERAGATRARRRGRQVMQRQSSGPVVARGG